MISPKLKGKCGDTSCSTVEWTIQEIFKQRVVTTNEECFSCGFPALEKILVAAILIMCHQLEGPLGVVSSNFLLNHCLKWLEA